MKLHSNDKLKNLIRSLQDKNNGLQQETVSYEDVEQYLRLLQNDCSTGHDKIPAMFIKLIIVCRKFSFVTDICH